MPESYWSWTPCHFCRCRINLSGGTLFGGLWRYVQERGGISGATVAVCAECIRAGKA